MKKFYSILCVLVLFISGCGGYGRAVSPYELESLTVYDVPNLKKDEIFERSKIWIAKTFKSAKAVIEYEDKETGVIVGNGAVTCHANAGLAEFNVLFTLEEEIKDGKIRIKINNVHTQRGIKFYEAYKQEAMAKIEALKQDLHDYLLQASNKSDW